MTSQTGGDSQAAHSFTRGNSPRSRIATRRPARVKVRAHVLPAGPPPTINASNITLSSYHGLGHGTVTTNVQKAPHSRGPMSCFGRAHAPSHHHRARDLHAPAAFCRRK